MFRTIAILLSFSVAQAFELPATSSQCLVGIVDDWNSSHVMLQFFEKHGNDWRATTEKWNGRIGKNGLAWGLGLHPLPTSAKLKHEGDFRTPAGVFHIGGVWGSEPTIQKHALLPYHQVTSRDLWIEDSASPFYNQHITLSHEPRTSWEKRQQMKQNDPAHALKLFIAHNSTSIQPHAGSSIFFHIWRANGKKATSGCTTMAEEKLRRLISLIDPSRQPLFIILPRTEYMRLQNKWELPDITR